VVAIAIACADAVVVAVARAIASVAERAIDRSAAPAEARRFGRNTDPEQHGDLLAGDRRVRHYVQVVRSRWEIVGVKSQSKAAVGELAAKACCAGITEPQVCIGHWRGVGWDVHKQLHAIDAAALHALIQFRALVQCVAHDQKVAVGVQLVTSLRRLDAHHQ
jgi:hypothetical protein